MIFFLALAAGIFQGVTLWILEDAAKEAQRAAQPLQHPAPGNPGQ